MECDSMHSTIEGTLRKMTMNVPADYIRICKTAQVNSIPYHVLM